MDNNCNHKGKQIKAITQSQKDEMAKTISWIVNNPNRHDDVRPVDINQIIKSIIKEA